jgi:lactate dehydrogenase-like 2-hydroxyacid dehydrogenase
LIEEPQHLLNRDNLGGIETCPFLVNTTKGKIYNEKSIVAGYET